MLLGNIHLDSSQNFMLFTAIYAIYCHLWSHSLLHFLFFLLQRITFTILGLLKLIHQFLFSRNIFTSPSLLKNIFIEYGSRLAIILFQYFEDIFLFFWFPFWSFMVICLLSPLAAFEAFSSTSVLLILLWHV